MPTSVGEQNQNNARDAIDVLLEIATLLVCERAMIKPKSLTNDRLQNTHLDRQTLSLCVSLIENGVNPEALAVSLSDSIRQDLMGKLTDDPGQTVIRELRQKTEEPSIKG